MIEVINVNTLPFINILIQVFRALKKNPLNWLEKLYYWQLKRAYLRLLANCISQCHLFLCSITEMKYNNILSSVSHKLEKNKCLKAKIWKVEVTHCFKERNTILWLKMKGRELQTQLRHWNKLPRGVVDAPSLEVFDSMITEVEGKSRNVFGDGSRFKKRDQWWKMLFVLFWFKLQEVKIWHEKNLFCSE